MKSNLKIIFITIMVLNNLTMLGQDHVLDWAKSMGGIYSDAGYSTTIDASGNIYTTGSFENTVDFDPGPGTSFLTSQGSSDIFIQKLDSAGNFIWAKSVGGTSFEQGYSIVTDASGYIYATGYFRNTVDFNPGPGTFNITSQGSIDVFILKLDSAGNFIWAKAMGGTDSEAGKSIITDASGNIYTTGYFEGTVDFDPGPGTSFLATQGGQDIFIQKLDSAGNFIWAKSVGGTDNDMVNSITTDTSGNIYTTGYFRNTVDFNPGLGNYNITSQGDNDIFIQKLDNAGNFVWAKSIGGTGHDRGESIIVDLSGNIYTTGFFRNTADFDPGVGTFNLTAVGISDIFILKLSPSGNFLWAKSMGGTSYGSGTSIITDAYNNVYTTGTYSGTVDFDPGLGSSNSTSLGGRDIFIQKLDAAGNFLWVKAIGGTQDLYSSSIATDTENNIYTTGHFRNTVDFDPGLGIYNITSQGSTDIFIQKLKIDCSTTGTDFITACDSFTWIDGNTYTVSNNSATHTLTNAAGCDSVVTLDLTINNSTTGTDVVTACDSYTWIDGNTYTASNNTATYTLTNVDGCDSVVTLDLTINTVDISVIENGVTLTANLDGASYQWIDCNDNNNPIAGETNQSYTATTDGSYAVIVDDGNCVGTSICYAVIGVDAEAIKETAVNIYPNPTNGIVFVQGEGIEKIVVTDVSGRIIKQVNTSQQQVTLDLTGNVQGIYFVNIVTKNGRIIRKILLK